MGARLTITREKDLLDPRGSPVEREHDAIQTAKRDRSVDTASEPNQNKAHAIVVGVHEVRRMARDLVHRDDVRRPDERLEGETPVRGHRVEVLFENLHPLHEPTAASCTWGSCHRVRHRQSPAPQGPALWDQARRPAPAHLDDREDGHGQEHSARDALRRPDGGWARSGAHRPTRRSRRARACSRPARSATCTRLRRSRSRGSEALAEPRRAPRRERAPARRRGGALGPAQDIRFGMGAPRRARAGVSWPGSRSAPPCVWA